MKISFNVMPYLEADPATGDPASLGTYEYPYDWARGAKRTLISVATQLIRAVTYRRPSHLEQPVYKATTGALLLTLEGRTLISLKPSLSTRSGLASLDIEFAVHGRLPDRYSLGDLIFGETSKYQDDLPPAIKARWVNETIDNLRLQLQSIKELSQPQGWTCPDCDKGSYMLHTPHQRHPE